MGTGTFSSSAIFLLSVVVSGYIYCAFCYRWKYITYREAGHRLYLSSASFGFLFILVAELLLLLLVAITTLVQHVPWVHTKLNLCLYVYGQYHLPIISSMAPVLSLLVTQVYNGTPDAKDKNVRRAWEKDDLAALLGLAADEKRPIAVTLDTRKVYVGFVARTNEPHEYSGITILPTYSGYRREADLKMMLPNRYEEVFAYLAGERREDFPVHNFYIVLPVRSISACHIFNDEIYERLNPPVAD